MAMSQASDKSLIQRPPRDLMAQETSTNLHLLTNLAILKHDLGVYAHDSSQIKVRSSLNSLSPAL